MTKEERSAYNRADYARKKQDPEWLARRRIKAAIKRRKKLENPEIRKAVNEKAKLRHRERVATDPEYRERKWAQAKAYEADWRKDNPEEARIKTKRSRYNLTREEYDELVEQSQGLCAICRRPESLTLQGRVCMLAIDHCHKTGKVRGMLCSECNKGLGNFNDDTGRMAKAITYLEQDKP